MSTVLSTLPLIENHNGTIMNKYDLSGIGDLTVNNVLSYFSAHGHMDVMLSATGALMALIDAGAVVIENGVPAKFTTRNVTHVVGEGLDGARFQSIDDILACLKLGEKVQELTGVQSLGVFLKNNRPDLVRQVCAVVCETLKILRPELVISLPNMAKSDME